MISDVLGGESRKLSPRIWASSIISFFFSMKEGEHFVLDPSDFQLCILQCFHAPGKTLEQVHQDPPQNKQNFASEPQQ
jgi:hypothetical protein